MRTWEISVTRGGNGRWYWSLSTENSLGGMSLVLDSPGSYATATLAAGFADLARKRLEAEQDRRSALAAIDTLVAAYGIEDADAAGLSGAERRAWSASA
jgi:hypothetical protein